MNRNNQPGLEKLLLEAMKSVTITRKRSQDRLSPIDYRRRVLTHRTRHDPSLRLYTSLYEPDIADSAVREAVLELVRSELKEFLREDRTYAATYVIFGGLGSGSSVDDIFKSLLTAAIVDTPQWAAMAFFDEISRGYLPFQEFYMLTGVKVENQVQVFDGISFIPLPNSTPDLPGYLPDLLGTDSSDFLAGTLLRVDMSVAPVLYRPETDYTLESGPERHFTRALRSTELTDFNPAKFFQALTFVAGNPVLSAVRWTHMSDEHIFDLRLGFGSGYSRSRIDAPSTNISEAQVRDATDLYHKIMALPQAVEESLKIPIDRWMNSRTYQGHVDKMIDLGIAMESFYLRGIGEQLTFRFRLRGSLHLGKGVAERKRLMKEFGGIYRYRSQAVHEGTLPERVSVDGESIPMGQYIERSQELFSRSLMKVIESGAAPDWESIELGNGEEADDPSSEVVESHA